MHLLHAGLLYEHHQELEHKCLARDSVNGHKIMVLLSLLPARIYRAEHAHGMQAYTAASLKEVIDIVAILLGLLAMFLNTHHLLDGVLPSTCLDAFGHFTGATIKMLDAMSCATPTLRCCCCIMAASCMAPLPGLMCAGRCGALWPSSTPR